MARVCLKRERLTSNALIETAGCQLPPLCPNVIRAGTSDKNLTLHVEVFQDTPPNQCSLNGGQSKEKLAPRDDIVC